MDLSHRTMPKILCCICGTPMEPNLANMCLNCLRQRVDITEGIPRQMGLTMCKACGRWFQPPNHWVTADLESRELLSLCLKRIRGMKDVQLVDAGFLWTEPHSRRVRVKLAIQKQVIGGALLQQEIVVEYVVSTQQCDICTKAQTPHTWSASVQLRQRVSHRRTLLYLEQLILKHNAHENAVSISSVSTGLDFFFSKKNHAIKFVDFVQTLLPVRVKASEKLISHDTHNNVSVYKHSIAVEIAPICKDELVYIPHRIAAAAGISSPLQIALSVENTFQLMDVVNLHVTTIQGVQYWKSPFLSLMTIRQMVQFTVLDVELTGVRSGKFAQADVVVARTSDFGKNDTTFVTRSHLGNILHPGDFALGYDVCSANLPEGFGVDFERFRKLEWPDVVLVRKTYPRHSRRRRQRSWKLRELEKAGDDVDGRGKSGLKSDEDYELFLRELEEDPELRSHVNLYKAIPRGSKEEMHSETDDDDDFPEVKLSELLEEMTVSMAEDDISADPEAPDDDVQM